MGHVSSSAQRWKRHLAVIAMTAVLGSSPAFADCAATPYLGSICVTGASFCPRGYVEANGALLPISTNQALFSLLGCTYGGDCKTSFALPNLQSRWAVQTGQGPGLSPISQGQTGGSETTTLTVSNLAPHTHTAVTTVALTGRTTDEADSSTPANTILGDPSAGQTGDRDIYSTQSPNTSLSSDETTATTEVADTGANLPVALRNPYLGLRYCLATAGLYPPRN
jgi:microcystin-dependent protein